MKNKSLRISERVIRCDGTVDGRVEVNDGKLGMGVVDNCDTPEEEMNAIDDDMMDLADNDEDAVERDKLGEEEEKELENLVKRNADIFEASAEELGTYSGDKMLISLKDGTSPIYVPPYRKSLKERDLMKKEVD